MIMGRFSDYDYNEKECENVGPEKIENSSEMYEKIIDKYSKLSEQELLQEFMNLTVSKKKNGSISGDDLEKMKATLSPYLSDTQKNNLDKIIKLVNDV